MRRITFCLTLAILPFLCAGPLQAAETPPAAPKKTYSADDPVVKLAMKLHKLSVFYFTSEERDEASSSEARRPRLLWVTLNGPDENGQYSFTHPCEKVCKIRLDGAPDERKLLSPEDIRAVARLFPNVETFEISVSRDPHRRTELFLRELDAFRNLKDLKVALPELPTTPNSDKPSEWTAERRAEVSRVLFCVIPRLPRLEKLNVNRSDLSDDDFRNLGKSRSLREVIITYNGRQREDSNRCVPPVHDFAASSLVDAVAEIKELRHLNTNGCRWVGPVDWDKLAALPHLETLNCSFSGLDDERLPGIEKLPHLKSLDLYSTPITGKSLDHLRELKSLERLYLRNTKVGGNILALAESPNLKEVDYPVEPFHKYALTPEEFEFFIRSCRSGDTATIQDPQAHPLGRINQLVPGGISQISLRSFDPQLKIGCIRDGVSQPKRIRCFYLRRPLVAADFERLEGLTSLTDLWIESRGESVLTDEQIARFASLPNLVQVGLTLDKPLTAGILSHFANHPTIERLSLSDVRLDAEAAKYIASLPNLYSLNLTRGSVDASFWQPLARAEALRKLKLDSISVEGPPGTRFRGIEQIPVLESLTVRSKEGDDDECRWIGRCETLRELYLEGTFSATAIERLTPMPNLETVYLTGSVRIPQPDEQLRVLRFNPRLRRVGLNNNDRKAGRTNRIYSISVARETGIAMDGPCSCGCMDIEPDNAMVVPGNRFTIQDDRLVLDEELFSRVRGSKASPLSHNGRLRFLVPIRRKRLRIECASLPKGVWAIYFNACQVDRLELVDCNLSEFGVFGSSDVGRMHMIESENRTPPEPGKLGWHSAHTLYLAGVRELTVSSSAIMHGLVVSCAERLRALQLDGDFPELQRLNLEGVPELRYLEAPHAGHAPKLYLSAFSCFSRDLGELPSLRLLKMPGTALGQGQLYFPHLAKMSRLHEVDMRKTQIDDEWLERLEKIKTLRILRIGGCENLTAEGIAQFRKTRPEVEVVE